MRFSLAAVALFSSVVSVLGADHLVLVGGNSTLTFNPSSIQAAQGDTVTFEFRSKNHSVTQSTFANPCSIMTTPTVGVDSGFQATSNTTTTFAQWQITIDNSSAPLWFFCAQTNPKNHCQAGMVFAVNANANKTFAAYLQNAMNDVNVVNATSPTANSSSTAGSSSAGASSVGASSIGASSIGASSVGASFTTSAAAGASSAASSIAGAVAASTMVTSLGTIPTNAVPVANTGLSGASVTGSGTSNSTQNNSAMRLGSSTVSGLLVAGLVAGLIL